MTERLVVDVAIIGGGTAACAAAVALREDGLTVAVLEKRLCGAGASKAATSPNCRWRAGRVHCGMI